VWRWSWHSLELFWALGVGSCSLSIFFFTAPKIFRPGLSTRSVSSQWSWRLLTKPTIWVGWSLAPPRPAQRRGANCDIWNMTGKRWGQFWNKSRMDWSYLRIESSKLGCGGNQWLETFRFLACKTSRYFAKFIEPHSTLYCAFLKWTHDLDKSGNGFAAQGGDCWIWTLLGSQKGWVNGTIYGTPLLFIKKQRGFL
jgi:hypothetical protein